MAREPIDELRDICTGKYRDSDLTEMVVADAQKLGTVDAILEGSRTLPSKQDAINHRNRLLGIGNATPTESAQQLTIVDLQRRLRLLEEQSGASPPAMGQNTTQS